MKPPFAILWEDNHLLVINKPAGLPTMGVEADRPSVIGLAKEYLKQKYDKPGNVFLGIVSRLDAPTTGALLVARTSKAAARLSQQFRDGLVGKTYWALVERAIRPAQGRCLHWLQKHERHRRVEVVSREQPGAQEARLAYTTLARLGSRALLEVQLETGRKHQIRVQLADRGAAVVGDRKYGAAATFSEGIALHCRRLEFTHPVRKTDISIVAPLPPSWRAAGVDENELGG